MNSAKIQELGLAGTQSSMAQSAKQSMTSKPETQHATPTLHCHRKLDCTNTYTQAHIVSKCDSRELAQHRAAGLGIAGKTPAGTQTHKRTIERPARAKPQAQRTATGKQQTDAPEKGLKPVLSQGARQGRSKPADKERAERRRRKEGGGALCW